jgi:hypothetical protein
MKAIIDRKRYDTETARKIAKYCNGLGSGDFRNVSEGLYVTKAGSYFLAGSGGPMTKYAEGNGNTTWGSSKIIPMTKDEAYSWMERKGEFSKEIEEEFPDMVVDA